MKRTIFIGLIFVLLIGILTACGKETSSSPIAPNQGSNTPSDRESKESLIELPTFSKNLRLDRMEQGAANTDRQYTFHYKYYDNYIECIAESRVCRIIYYDENTKTAYLGNTDASIDEVKKGEWYLSVTYDENDKIISFGRNSSFSSYDKCLLDYESEKKIVLSTEWITKTPEGEQHQKGNTNILEFKEDSVILYDKDTSKAWNEYFLSNNRISNFTINLSGDECENTLEYDEFGSLVKATKAYSDKAFEFTFSYVVDEKPKVWHDLATVSNLPTGTVMEVYLLTEQTLG